MTPTNLIDNEVSSLIKDEIKRQEFELQMIASENYASPAVMEVMGSVLTNKYAEGYPGKRYYNGCDHVDTAESLAIERVKKLFNCKFANVQPHSGAQANMAVFLGFLEPGDTVLGMSLDHGGHLSHGSKVNFSGRIYNSISYGVDENTFLIDYDQIEELAIKNKPKIIIANTIKGKGVSFMENSVLWHYKPLDLENYKKAIKILK